MVVFCGCTIFSRIVKAKNSIFYQRKLCDFLTISNESHEKKAIMPPLLPPPFTFFGRFFIFHPFLLFVFSAPRFLLTFFLNLLYSPRLSFNPFFRQFFFFFLLAFLSLPHHLKMRGNISAFIFSLMPSYHLFLLFSISLLFTPSCAVFPIFIKKKSKSIEAYLSPSLFNFSDCLFFLLLHVIFFIPSPSFSQFLSSLFLTICE